MLATLHLNADMFLVIGIYTVCQKLFSILFLTIETEHFPINFISETLAFNDAHSLFRVFNFEVAKQDLFMIWSEPWINGRYSLHFLSLVACTDR